MFVHIYDKGHDKTPHGISSPHICVTPLLNAGREGRTWLDHFIRHYDDLAEWTYLAQGEPHQDPEDFKRRLRVRYGDTTALTREYMPHFPPRWIKDEDLVEWHDGIEVRYGRAIYQGGRSEVENAPWLRLVWPHFFACPVPDPLRVWTYGYGAMYAVPKHRILGRSLAYWQWCHDVIARPEQQQEHTWGSGYAFELLWRYLLGDPEKYPARMPDNDLGSGRVVAEVENCRHGDGTCGCDARPRRCNHPARTPEVWRRDCLDCPFRPALDWFPRG